MPNDYIGEGGADWLEQIAITRGQTPLGEPEFPQAIADKIRSMPRPPQPPPAPIPIPPMSDED
jgi:hypothetical protein